MDQINDARFKRVLGLGIGLTLGLFIALYVLVVILVQWVTPDSFTLPVLGEITVVDDILSGASVILMMILSVFLMVPVASAFTGLFLDDVADAVEDKHYAHMPKATRLSLSETARETLRFLGVLIAANLLALIAYVVLAPFAPFIFYALNGYLLGREYFFLTALRRLGADGARKLHRKNLGTVWLAGTLMALPLTVPIVNLAIPVLGAATFTHLFHKVSKG